MSIAMLRIDDRLIHGQVIIGWCPCIQPDHIVLCNDEVARDPWEREIYTDAASGYPISICTVEETVRLLQNEKLRDKKVLLVVDSPRVVVQLIKLGLRIDKVIVGGMHYQTGKRQITPFVYVDDEDIECFHFLKNHCVQLECKEAPGSESIDLAKLLGSLNLDSEIKHRKHRNVK